MKIEAVAPFACSLFAHLMSNTDEIKNQKLRKLKMLPLSKTIDLTPLNSKDGSIFEIEQYPVSPLFVTQVCAVPVLWCLPQESLPLPFRLLHPFPCLSIPSIGEQESDVPFLSLQT